MQTIRTMPTLKLLAMLPGASAELRVRIEAVLKTRIVPMPCVQIQGR